VEEQVVVAPNRQHSTVCIRESKGLASTRTKVHRQDGCPSPDPRTLRLFPPHCGMACGRSPYFESLVSPIRCKSEEGVRLAFAQGSSPAIADCMGARSYSVRQCVCGLVTDCEGAHTAGTLVWSRFTCGSARP
jgi:hypothetical protein